jgi:phage tail-like protein
VAETGKRNDPFLAFRYEVQLDDLAVAGFSEISGLALETEVQDYPEGGLNSHLKKFPGRSKQTNLVLKRGIVGRDLWQWYWDLTQGTVKRRSGSIVVKDPAGGDDVLTFQFRDAFPVKWQGPELNAGQSAVAVETLELTHEGLELVS